MISTFHFDVPRPDRQSLGERTVSAGDFDRYGGLGGFVDIRNAVQDRRSSDSNRLPSRLLWPSSPTTPDTKSSNSSLEGVTTCLYALSSPVRSEGWTTPDTPITPLQIRLANKKTGNRFSLKPKIRSSSENFGRQATLSSDANCLDNTTSLCNSSSQSQRPEPVELPGSLLLPSQGFSQSVPPIPPYRHKRRLSELPYPTDTCADLLNFPLPSDFQVEETMLSALSLRSMSRNNVSSAALPPRTTSLVDGPAEFLPPVPLSQMKIEELMQVLPTLDAAIIAHDWIPCMQKRHAETKMLLQERAEEVLEANLKLQTFIENVQNIFDRSENVAEICMDMAETSKELQHKEVETLKLALEESERCRKEVVSVLARQVSRHKDVCVQHERQSSAMKTKADLHLGILVTFLEEHFQESLNGSMCDSREVLEIINNYKLDGFAVEGSESHNSELSKLMIEREEMRKLLDGQQTIINKQSADLDHYITQLSKSLGVIRERDIEIGVLSAEIISLQEALEQRNHSSKQVLHHRSVAPMKVEKEVNPNTALAETFSAHDAEITNSRHKLEKTRLRESQLQAQTQQPTSSVHQDKPVNQGLFKRFLTGQPKDADNFPTNTKIPRSTSLQTLPLGRTAPFPAAHRPHTAQQSHNLTTHSTTTKHAELSTPTTQPSTPSICDSAAEDIDWPTLPPRIRHTPAPGSDRNQKPQNKLCNARFQQMPSNLSLRIATDSAKPVGSSAKHNVPSSINHGNNFGLVSNAVSNDQLYTARNLSYVQSTQQSHPRVLSGITEVSENGILRSGEEETGRRRARWCSDEDGDLVQSASSGDGEMLRDSIDAYERLRLC